MIPTQPQNVPLEWGPDQMRYTRTDLWTNGLPLIIPQPGPGSIDIIRPIVNLTGRMPGNGWFPYYLPAAPYENVGGGPMVPNQTNRYGGSGQTVTGTFIRNFLRGLFGETPWLGSQT